MHRLWLALLLSAALVTSTNALACPGTEGLIYGPGGGVWCCHGVRTTGSRLPSSTDSSMDTYQPFIILNWDISPDESLRPGMAGLEIDAGTTVSQLTFSVWGGPGDDVGANAGATASGRATGTFDKTTPATTLKAAILLNIKDGQELESPAGSVRGVDYGLGGGYSAIADAACLEGRSSLEFSEGDECRWLVAAGGGGAGPSSDGSSSTCDSFESTSAGGRPVADAQGLYKGGGGGGGIRGGAASPSGQGCAGSEGLVEQIADISDQSSLPPVGSPRAQIRFQLEGRCELLVEGDVTTVPSSIDISTRYRRATKATVTVDAGTTISRVYSTQTFTALDISTSTITLTGPTTTILTTATSATTPPTATVTEQTDVRNLPSGRPPVATTTVFETVTTEPATVVASQTATAEASSCSSYRVVYPAACCPAQYLPLESVEALERRDGEWLQPGDYVTWYATTVTEGVLTTTTTIDWPPVKTVSSTFVYTLTEGVEGPWVTNYETTRRTIRVPGPRSTSTTIAYSEAPTPLVTSTSTRFLRAPLSVLTPLLFPTTTITVSTTTTLPTPTTTVTSSPSAACAVETVQAFALDKCPYANSVGAQTRLQAVQQTRLEGYKAKSGGQPVVVDCGSSGSFTY
ncbi:hypothetical protein JCM3775_004100 [Rhodotorula graminis]